MTNYYQNLTKEAKRETIASLEFKRQQILETIKSYRNQMDGLDEDSWQIPACAQMISYWTNELGKVLKVLELVTSED